MYRFVVLLAVITICLGRITPRDSRSVWKTKFGSRDIFSRYLRYDEIYEYLFELQENFPNLAKVESLGKTYEGRDQYIIKISSGGNGSRPAMFIDATVHAREWIAAPTALYTIQQLVEYYDDNRELLDNADWFIVPVANPDGYEYTHTTNSFWRKTREPSDSGCSGTDMNRNFDFHWGEDGSASNPCSGNYRGSQPFSILETDNLRRFELAHKSQIKGYLALHCCGNIWLYPYGYAVNQLPDDWKELEEAAQEAAIAIKAVNGNIYEVGNSATALYPASGASDDYAKAVIGAKYAYTVEIEDVPETGIRSVVTEVFEGIKVIGKRVGRLE